MKLVSSRRQLGQEDDGEAETDLDVDETTPSRRGFDEPKSRRHVDEESDGAATMDAGEFMPSGRGLGENLPDGSAAKTGADETTPFGMGVEKSTATPAGRRRLDECDDCVQTWDTLCDKGLETVCNVVEYGNPISSAAGISIFLFCSSFGSLCGANTGYAICADECEDVECLPPLTVTLEYRGLSSRSASFGPYLDLYVIEPEGKTAYFNAPATVRERYTNLPNDALMACLRCVFLIFCAFGIS